MVLVFYIASYVSRSRQSTDGKIFIQGEDITDLSRRHDSLEEEILELYINFFNLILFCKKHTLPLLLDGHREKNYFKNRNTGIAESWIGLNQLSVRTTKSCYARSLVTRPALFLLCHRKSGGKSGNRIHL